MTMIFSALALALAAPAATGAAPANDPHAGHAQHDGARHDGAKHDCKQCCDKMKQQGGKMECGDKQGEAKPAPTGGHTGHDGHAH